MTNDQNALQTKNSYSNEKSRFLSKELDAIPQKIKTLLKKVKIVLLKNRNQRDISKFRKRNGTQNIK